MADDLDPQEKRVWEFIRLLHEDRDFSVIETHLGKPAIAYGDVDTTVEEVQEAHREALSKWDDITCTLDRSFSDGPNVAIKWRMDAKLVESFQGIAGTGREREVEIVTLATVEDGDIVDIFEEYDRRQWLPTVSRLAWSGILDNMNDGILVLDDEGAVVDANRRALELLDSDREALLDCDAATLFEEDVTIPAVDERAECPVDSGRCMFELETSAVTDTEGERVGRTVLFRDVTARKRRSRQLQVLNRVLRHNLRNALTTIVGQAEYLDRTEKPAPERMDRAVETVLATAEELTDLSEKVQRVEDVFASETVETRRQNVTDVFAAVLARMERAFPEADLEVDTPGSATVLAVPSLEVALEAVVENACEHNDADDPQVRVTAERVDGAGAATAGADGPWLRVCIADNGPGIPDNERRVFETREETPLEHSSGLDLWLVYWVVVLSEGDLSFADNEPRGTVVTIDLPLAEPELQSETAEEADVTVE
jgi:signal transduction histidine kinase